MKQPDYSIIMRMIRLLILKIRIFQETEYESLYIYRISFESS